MHTGLQVCQLPLTQEGISKMSLHLKCEIDQPGPHFATLIYEILMPTSHINT